MERSGPKGPLTALSRSWSGELPARTRSCVLAELSYLSASEQRRTVWAEGSLAVPSRSRSEKFRFCARDGLGRRVFSYCYITPGLRLARASCFLKARSEALRKGDAWEKIRVLRQVMVWAEGPLIILFRSGSHELPTRICLIQLFPTSVLCGVLVV